MRLATSTIHALGYSAIAKDTADLYKIQGEFATQKRINSASDDPSGAARASELSSTKAISDQYTRNQTSAQGTLEYGESLVGNVGDLMQSVQDTLIQAGNGSLSSSDKASLSIQLKSQLAQMLNLANSKDSTGKYLFAGFNEGTQPFNTTQSGTVYTGDNGQKSLQVSSSVSMQVNVSGADLFMGVKGGNGVIQTAASTSNTGTGLIDGGSVADATAYNGSGYNLSIVNGSSGLEVSVTNSATSAVVASGIPYVSGQAIAIPLTAGGSKVLSVGISGSVAAGDSFTVGAAQPSNVFDTMNAAINALDSNTKGVLSNSALSDALRQAQSGVAQSFDRSLAVRSQFGSSMQELTRQQDTTTAETNDLSARISAIVDLDPAKAATDLAQAQLALSASQQIYTSLAKQSLFNYLS
jgi:flagellar hook-associated protein 3 FlgL